MSPGAEKLTVADALPPLAVTLLGASGTPAGVVMGLLLADPVKLDTPTAFSAATVMR